jgi:uncharacterized protein involved in propanediol utilization
MKSCPGSGLEIPGKTIRLLKPALLIAFKLKIGEITMSLQMSMQSAAPAQALSSGEGMAIAQHGELFQGAIYDGQDHLRRCLVSLPCAKLHSTGRFVFTDQSGITVVPAHKEKARRAAELSLESWNVPFTGGILTIESNISEGKGMGSSTADCTAAVLALANALQKRLTAQEVAQFVVRAEIASGNTMFERAVLFAHREGRVLEYYLQPLPHMTVLGIDTDKEHIVETLKFPPAVYCSREIEKFKVLTAALRRAISVQDARLLGRVSTASAEINQQFLPKPFFNEICQISRMARALGVSVAHSGTVMALLFDSHDPELDAKTELTQELLSELGFRDILKFEI